LEFVGVTPSVSTWHDAALRACSPATPFSFPFAVNVTAGAFPLTLAEVRFHSADPFRSTSPPTVFDSSGLTRQFASSVTVARFSSRAFPFTHVGGCPLGGTILQVFVKTTDSTGIERLSSMSVPMR
jgi:hypothetical protein